MVVFIFILAVVFSLIYLNFLRLMEEEDVKIAIYNKILDNQEEMEKLFRKADKNSKTLDLYSGVSRLVAGLFLPVHYDKKINKIAKENDKLKSGNIKSVGVWNMPGYVLFRKWELIGKSDFHKKLMIMSNEVYGRKYGKFRARKIIANMISILLLISSISMIFGAFIQAGNSSGEGLLIILIGMGAAGILAYGMYDEIKKKAEKRIKSIRRQFPNIASKLALLVTSGMVMDRAWKLTAYSSDKELYLEMQKTSKELDNLIPPKVAYGEFINRCNSKETTSLASAILQNMSKGNAEIGRFLNKIAQDAWIERRHMAKRDSENATSQLMIPTLILFISIMMMILVPIAMNFGGF